METSRRNGNEWVEKDDELSEWAKALLAILH
jgi:hypothetical protein